LVETNPWPIVAELAEVLDDLGARYAVGGSLASGLAGEPRSTMDADITVDLYLDQVDTLVNRLSNRFYVPAERLRQAVRDRTSVNLIHLETAMKLDLFIAGGTPIDGDVLRRRLSFKVGHVDRPLHVHTPEDVLLHKLRWYRKGGEVSDRQWRDVIGIVRVQGARLDRDYLARGAALLAVSDLLERALAQM
jgi:hypothetical protein